MSLSQENTNFESKPVPQVLIKRSGKILTVRSRKYRTYQAAVSRDLEVPEDLQEGDTIFVEFRNGTPMVTGFELKPRESEEEYQERVRREREEVLALGGDY